mmetsp:Transcript_74247/g.206311  ORF Transcript_74247/g.206311 Transcript_74247/m.206311 type:complete len:252 (+) Transcript_74247:117-872(+)|eukprot:CAMPEP_0117535040 /NCGR_PEP_ID=MMETSP0784-20121206/40728_1 /TAXON_ID=39447 /ORGANISM="" /LENGTH=251 /DNA_ID=CAMNT_0005331551 /DNA_START=108 /DNA_END=863 /DNA_ORIENTATION=+
MSGSGEWATEAQQAAALSASGATSAGAPYIEDTPTSPSADVAPASEPVAFSLRDLQEVRARHHAAYREREEQSERDAQQMEMEAQRAKDAAIAEQLAAEEEEARQRQVEADEEYSRQLAAQLNPGAEQQMQDMGGGMMPSDVPLDDSDGDFGSSYHQLEDGDGGYRMPMRTGYVDRLIDPVQERFRGFDFPPLLAADGLGFAWGAARDVDHAHGSVAGRFPLLSRWAPAMCLFTACIVLGTILVQEGRFRA